MKTLILDNYDSFSHILFQYLGELNGERPLFIRNDEWTLDRIREARFDNILISPGPGRPDRPADFGVCAAVIDAFPDTPILGVCLGHQGLGMAAGAPVVAAPRVRHGKPSRIRHHGGDLFAGLPQGFEAIRYHSLVVDPGSLPGDLEATAFAEDDGQIMGLRYRKRPCYGVQFHPESAGTSHGKALLANFRDLTAARRGISAGCESRSAQARGPGPAGYAGPEPAAPAEEPVSAPRPGTSRPEAPPPARVCLELPWRDPESVFHHRFRSEPAAFWLDSLAAPVPGEPLVSYIGSGRILREVRGSVLRSLEIGADGGLRELSVRRGDPFAALDAVLGRGGDGGSDASGGGDGRGGGNGRGGAAGTVGSPPSPAAFAGGLVGWLGYELKRHAGGGDLEGTPPAPLPDALFVEPSRLLTFDHAARAVRAEALAPDPAAPPAPEDLAWLEDLAAAWDSLGGAPELRLDGPSADAGSIEGSPLGGIGLPVALSASRDAYLESIRILQQAIREGETYEACLTNEARVAADADPWEVYRILRRINPAPYAAFLRFPQACVLSASPERFLKLDADGRLSSRPIKGTRRRGATPEEDAMLRASLAENPKDRSENLMILDLVRNDFGKVCDVGSVTVPEQMVVEAHPTVFQLVSTVEGRLGGEYSCWDAIRACFPGGSMTGAPKKRTLELLEARERRSRGVFSGALGWIGRDGALNLGMVIRTLIFADGEYRVGCGGAILAESEPQAEFEEAMLKATAPLRALDLAVRRRSGGWILRG